MVRLGESCLLYRIGDGANPASVRRVHRLWRQVESARAAGELAVRDAVPGYDSLALHFDPLVADVEALHQIVTRWIDETDVLDGDEEEKGQLVTLPVRYDGPDLDRVAMHAGLTPGEVVERHTRPTYLVAAIGFMPHFPYLLGLDPALAAPRLASPRTRVPAGSVGIGNDQTGVYPQASPGGWNLIGTTDPERLKTLQPGDRLRFETDGSHA